MHKISALIILSTILIAISPATLALEDNEVNYCTDEAVNQRWADMLLQAPGDHLIIKLFALRSGLCVMIDQGLITLDQGTDIFENERLEAAMQRRQEQEERNALPPEA